MTISSEIRKEGPYDGDGVVTSFPFYFKIFKAEDVLVVRADSAGAETTLVLNSDYTVTVAPDQNTSPGGTVVLANALMIGTTLTIASRLLNLQPVDLTNQGGFYPRVINDALDRLTILVQQLAERVSRSLKMAISTPSGVDPQLPAPTPETLIGWNSQGTGFINVSRSDAALYEFSQAGIGAVRRSVESKLRDIVSVKDFGAVGDGVTDDTESVIKAHTYANSIGASVSYSGISMIALQADAQIPLKTSVDFECCQIVILGGVNTPPSFSTYNTLYVVSDDACPLTTITGSVLASNLTEGAMFPTLGLFDGHGYARLKCGYQVPNRTSTGTQDYVQTFKVNRNGYVSQPLSTDISAFGGAITVSYRKTSERCLSIRNVSLVEGAWNNQIVFKIQRCNVQIDNFTLLFTGGTYDNIMAIIQVDNASDVWINNFVTTGRPVTTSVGSYCLDIEGGADIYVNGMNALTGWGAIGANDVNGVHYENSVINRVDVHSSGHNIFVDNCDLHTSGVIYGWGGGVLSIKNSRLYRCAAISHRTDYGGSFFGAMVVDGCEFTYNTSLGLAIVDLFGSPLGASTPVYAPKSISVTNCKRTGASSSLVNPGEVIPVRIKIKDAGSVVYAPTSISVHNITSQPLWRFSIYIDWLNMEANPQNWETILQFSGVFPTHAATTSTGVVEYASIRSPSQSVIPWIVGSDSNHIHIVCTSAATAQIILSNVGINGVAVNNVTPPRCLIDDCKFTNPASGYNSSTNLAPVGGPQVGNNAFTTIRNCEIGSSNVWNFGNVRGAIGNTIRGGSLTPVLPAGVTPTQFFTGWRASGAFQS